MNTENKIKIGLGIVVILVLAASPFGVYTINKYNYAVRKADDMSNYKTLKDVEDTCRSYIVSYESDKVMYEQYKNSDNAEEKKWANSAKIRANKTAITYNEYIQKNTYVFNGNIPGDLRSQLSVLE